MIVLAGLFALIWVALLTWAMRTALSSSSSGNTTAWFDWPGVILLMAQQSGYFAFLAVGGLLIAAGPLIGVWGYYQSGKPAAMLVGLISLPFYASWWYHGRRQGRPSVSSRGAVNIRSGGVAGGPRSQPGAVSGPSVYPTNRIAVLMIRTTDGRPVNFGSVNVRASKLGEDAGASPDDPGEWFEIPLESPPIRVGGGWMMVRVELPRLDAGSHLAWTVGAVGAPPSTALNTPVSAGRLP